MALTGTRIYQVGGSGGGGPYTVTADTPTTGDFTITDTVSSNTFVIPAPVAQSLNGVTSVQLSDNTAGNGGDEILFEVDGVQVGSVEILAGGITKWTLDGILDPVIFAGTPQTTVQRDALPTSAGYLVYNSDLNEYQFHNGTSWTSIGGSTSILDVLTSTSTTSALSANQGKVLKDEQDLQTSALGQGAGNSDMGTYTGAIVTDNQSAKQNIQELETAVEAIHADDDVEGVTGNLVDNTDARNPVVNAAVSADAEQLLKLGTDNLTMLDPDDLISADADNAVTKGTDGKLHVLLPSDEIQEWTASTDYAANEEFAFVPTQLAAVDIDGNTLVQNQRYIGSYRVGKTSSATLTLAEILLIDAYTESIGLRGEPVADNTALTALLAKDYERRKVIADGKEYVFELGALSGTLADDGTTGFWQEQIAAGLVTTYIDSSGGATVETLAASTVAGVVRLFTNVDVSNSATLAVQAGETLNGITDGTFLFSNYSADTQFRADEVTGGWIVGLDGASVSTDRSFHFSGVMDDYDPINGSNVIDFSTLVAGGNYPLQEGNTSGWRTSGTDFTPPKSGTYKFGINAYHPSSAIIGSNNQVGLGEFRGQIIINGTPIDFTQDTETGAPEAANGVIVLSVLDTDVIQFGFNSSADTNEDLYINCWIEPLQSDSVVLAGMVTPIALSRVHFNAPYGTGDLVSGVPNGGFNDIDFSTALHQNVDGITWNGSTEFTIVNDGIYKIDFDWSGASGAGTGQFTHQVDMLKNATEIASAQVHNTVATIGVAQNGACHYEGSFVAGDIIKLAIEGSGNISDVKGAGLTIAQQPTSTVVDPDALEVTDLHRFTLAKTSGQTTVPTTYPAQEQLTWQTAPVDTGGGVTGNTYVIPAGGDGTWKFKVSAETDQAGTMDGNSTIQITVNGTEVSRSGFATAGDNAGGGGSNDINYAQTDVEVDVITGDIIEAHVSMLQGIGITATQTTTYFQGRQVSTKTVINTTDLTVTNPLESDTTKVLKPNGNGTATFQSTELTPNAGAETLTGETFNGSEVYTQTFTGTTGTAGTYANILLAGNFVRVLNVVTAEVTRVDGTTHFGQNQTYTTGRYSFEVSAAGNFAIWNSDGTLFQSRPYSVTIKYTKV